MQRFDLGSHVAAAVVVVRKTECRAAASERRIPRARHDMRRFLGRADHRHHDAHCADVECLRDEVIFAARHAHHRHDVEPAAQRELRLQRFEAETRVLHVEQHELGAGVFADLRQPRREEFEHHGAVGASSRGERGFDGVVANHRILRKRGRAGNDSTAHNSGEQT